MTATIKEDGTLLVTPETELEVSELKRWMQSDVPIKIGEGHLATTDKGEATRT